MLSKQSYADRIVTTEVVRWPGAVHIPDRKAGEQKDFSPVIEAALASSEPHGTGGRNDPHRLRARDMVADVADKVIMRRSRAVPSSALS